MSRSRLVARNVLVMLLTQGILWALTSVVTLYVPGYLKDTGLGTITLAGSFASICSILVGLGTSTVLIKEIARNRSRTSELLAAVFVIRIPMGIISIGLGWAAARILGYTSSLCFLVFIALVGMAFAQLNDILGSVLAGLEDFPRQNAAAMAEKVVASILLIILVLVCGPLWAFVAVGIASTAISFSINILTLKPYLRSLHRPQWNTLHSLIIAGIPFLTNAIFIAIYGQSDALLLSKLSSVAAIGWYGLAKRLGGTTMVIPVALTTATLPTLSRMHSEDSETFVRAGRRLFNLVIICGMPPAMVLMFAPQRILSLLHYPPMFNRSIPVLAIMGGAIILWYLSQAAGTALIACDRQIIFSRVTGIAAVASIPLCAIGILTTEHFWANGAIGAMISDTLLEAYMVIAYIRALPKGLFAWTDVTIAGRAFIALLPSILLFNIIHNQHEIYIPLLGLVLYIPLCLLLGCLSQQDLALIRQLLQQKRKPL